MTQPFDPRAEADRWIRTGLSPHELRSALEYLADKAGEACREERAMVHALQRELVYSMCWPEEIGDETLVSRAYTVMGPLRFPIPADPEPLRQSLEDHQERLEALEALMRHADALREWLAPRLDPTPRGELANGRR